MHDSAYRIGELVMRTYSDLANAKILEVGSLNVNGCLRDAAAPTTHYVGLDLEEGPSVDLVITPGADFPVEDESFDLVMASSVFEHDARFWDTFLRMCRATRPGGHVYVNAPSNGTVHRYPMDCWRFYPDAGLALADYARSHGLEIDLVESFVGNRHSDVWNDFVAVFRKGPSAEPLNTAFVYHRYPSLNARTWQSRAVYNASDSTEDMSLIDELRRQNTSRSSADNAELVGQVATLESNLRQRQEEIEQAWAKVEDLTAQRDTLHERINALENAQERLQMRLAEADGWVFDLAGERCSLEKRLEAVQAELGRARIAITRMEAVSEFKQQQLHEYARQNVTALLEGKAALHGDIERLMERLEDRERTARESQERIAALTQTVASLRSDALEYHAKAAQALEQLSVMRSENKQQGRALRELEDRVTRKDRELNWLRRLFQLRESAESGWKAMLPLFLRRQRTAQILQRNRHFDANAYISRYPDVAEAGMDPLRHYILHGMAEGRVVDLQG